MLAPITAATRRFLRTCFLAGLLCLAFPGPGQAAGEGEPLINEYFVRQDVGEILFIRVNSFEAESRASVLDPNGTVLVSADLPFTRLAPLFLYVESPTQERQVDIRVESRLHTDRTRLELGVSRLGIRDDRTSKLAQAHQYLAFGMEELETDTPANWTVKINALMAAARAFESFGMEELRLWSQFYSAHFVFHKLNDSAAALQETEAALRVISSNRRPDIALALLRLRGDIVVAMREAAALPPRTLDADPVQIALSDLSKAAAALGRQFERARADFLRGKDLAARSQWSGALNWMEQALEVADDIGAGDLSTAIREDIVRIHDEQGDLAASSEVLQDIESQLQDGGNEEDLALNRLQQGEVLLSTFRYPEAIDVLGQALAAERNSMTRAQVSLALGRAYYGDGGFGEALAFLDEAVSNPASGSLRRPNPLLNIAEGLRLMANIHRQRGDWAAMNRVRSSATEYLDSDIKRAAHHYDRGLDALARGQTGSAANAFANSARAGRAAGQPRWGHLANLQACGTGAGQCDTGAMQSSLAWLMDAGLPAPALEGRRLRAAWLVQSGQTRSAFDALDDLVDEIYFLRRSMAGVMGAWFHEHTLDIFDDYLRQATAVSADASLLAFSKIRYAAQGLPATADLSVLAADLRVLVARRLTSVRSDEQAALAPRIDNSLGAGRRSFAADHEFLTSSGIQTYLASLQPDEAVLAFDIGPRRAQAWLAKPSGVRRISLQNAAGIHDALDGAASRLATLEGDAFDTEAGRLGRLLLAPLANDLPETVYWLPAGQLLGVPLDALRINGRYLAQDHQVAAVMGFPSSPGAARERVSSERVFLAGNPVNFTGEYLVQVQTNNEMRAVTNQFVGPGLNIVQGNALLPDEFGDERLSQANLVHLAMPARIDLARPGKSSFELSEPRTGAGRQQVNAEQMREGRLQAGLVFISRATTQGMAPYRFSSRLGIVDELLDAGAGGVVASLWQPSDAEITWLVSDFYVNLAAGPDTLDALSATKRRFMEAYANRENREWAAFQLYLP